MVQSVKLIIEIAFVLGYTCLTPFPTSQTSISYKYNPTSKPVDEYCAFFPQSCSNRYRIKPTPTKPVDEFCAFFPQSCSNGSRIRPTPTKPIDEFCAFFPQSCSNGSRIKPTSTCYSTTKKY
jgi:hypothetical protein